LSLLLNSPQDLEFKEPPVLENVDDTICTFNRKVVSVKTVKADGKGAYLRKGGSKKCYFYNGKNCQEAHLEENAVEERRFFVNSRTSNNATWSKHYVDNDSIFYVRRYYRYNKLNSFTQIIVEVEKHNQVPLDYFYVLYRWNKDALSREETLIGRHGNAKSPHAGTSVQ